MRTVLILAPHADDETLGCGGTLLRHVAEGDAVHWCLVTSLAPGDQYSQEWVDEREEEIVNVGREYGFASTLRLHLADARLDEAPLSEVVDAVRQTVQRIAPTDIYIPFQHDPHSDHRIVFSAAIAATKSFRCPTLKRWFAYETPSETDFGLNTAAADFSPNAFVDVSAFLEKKLDILRMFKSEIGDHPFPRNLKVVEARATLHGVAAGCAAAEAFMLLKHLR